MSDSPYINWFTSDFLNGVAMANMTAEQIGVYAIILNLIGDSGAPIDDDPAWIARRCNITTRKCSMILEQLAAMPNKIVRKNGVIGNKRMLSEVGRRDKKGRQARDAANERWSRYRDENKPQLPFEDRRDKSEIKSKKASKNNDRTDADAYASENDPENEKTRNYLPSRREIIGEINGEIISQNRENSAKNFMRTHPDSCAGVNPDPESIQTNSDSNLEESAREKASDGLDRSGDLMALLERVSAAAGYVPHGSHQLTDALDWIKAWRDLGADFDATVIPTIEAAILANPDRTSTLKRFDAKIRLAHATHSAKSKRGPAPPPPPVNLAPDGEPEDVHAFRADMHRHFGPRLYAQYLNRVRLEPVATANGSKPLRIVHSPGDPFRVLDDNRTAVTKAIAKNHGFTDVWE